MFAIVDKRIPEDAKKELSKYAQLILFESKNITYNAISGHPDVFIFKNGNKLILAPNIPYEFTEKIKKLNIEFEFGNSNVGKIYSETCKYNVVASFGIAVHNFKFTDTRVLGSVDSFNKINVKQGYTACNLVFLKENTFLTSDMGIFAALLNNKMNGRYINPKGIFLPNFEHGFFGGICGIYDKTFFTIGDILQLYKGEEIKNDIEKQGYEVVCLGKQLFDGGGIIFYNKKLINS